MVTSPKDRSNITHTHYSTISLALKRPSIKLDSPVISGVLALSSVPYDTVAQIDAVHRGSNPLTLSRMEPGTYRMTFSKSGFFNLSATAQFESGKITELNRTLLPLTGSLDIITNPAEADVRLDTTDLKTSPITLSNLTVGKHSLKGTVYPNPTKCEGPWLHNRDRDFPCSTITHHRELIIYGRTRSLYPDHSLCRRPSGNWLPANKK